MSFSLIPRYSFRKLTDITPEFLLGKGISLLLMDMDNTIAPYGMSEPDEFTRDWVHTMKTAGIELFIAVSYTHLRPHNDNRQADYRGHDVAL